VVRGVILLTALGLAALAPEPAGAEPRDACARGTRFRGKKIDIDLKDADLHDAFRLLADVGRANLVVPDDVRGTYHYHGPTPGPLEVLRAAGVVTTTVPGAAEVELYGILRDGTVVLGCTELDSSAPAGLDAQGGHIGDLRATDGTMFFTGRYHTHVCADAARGHLYTPEIQYYVP